MAVELALVTQFASAALMLGLAAWLMYLKPDGRAIQMFSLFLVLRAGITLANRFDQMATGHWHQVWDAYGIYYALAATPALIAFVASYLPARRASWWRWGMLATAGSMAAWFMADHCSVECSDGHGPLFIAYNALPLAMAVASILLFMGAARRTGSRAKAMELVALGLGINAALDGSIAAFLLVDPGLAAVTSQDPSFWHQAGFVVFAMGAPVALAGAILFGVQRRPFPWLTGTAYVLAVATGAIVVLGATLDEPQILFLLGIWRLALPILPAIALVRHRLFGTQIRARFAFTSGTLATFIAAAFVIGGEVIETLFDASDTTSSIIIAAIIALALRPIQVLLQRVTETVLPREAPTAASIDEREALLREEGVLGPKELALLEELARARAERLAKSNG